MDSTMARWTVKAPTPAFLAFHLKAGVRIATRSFIPLFSVFLAVLILQIDPAAAVSGLALSIFAARPALSSSLAVAALAFLLPYRAAPRLTHGLNGWIRHLPIDGRSMRRGIAAALAAVQLPLAISLAGLAFVAHTKGARVELTCFRLLVILGAGVMASLPVRRRWITVPLSVAAALLAITDGWSRCLIAAVLMVLSEMLSGALRRTRAKRPWRTTDSFLSFRIAWRALGWRTATAILFGYLPIGALLLFVANNDLPGSVASGAERLCGGMAAVLVMASLAGNLSSRRPAWPLARSFPWSSAQRVASDSAFLILHALLPTALLAARFPAAAWYVLGLLPLLSFRAAEEARHRAEFRGETVRFMAEGFALAALVSLLPWTILLCLLAAMPAFISARNVERTSKVTRWSDRRHSPFGDTMSWSA